MKFRPYSEDPEAPLIKRDLAEDITDTKEIIERHEGNLLRFLDDEADIIERFDGDITRFKMLKGLTYSGKQ